MISSFAAIFSVVFGLLVKLLDFVLEQKRKGKEGENGILARYLIRRNERLEAQVEEQRLAFAELRKEVSQMSIKDKREHVLKQIDAIESKVETATAIALLENKQRKEVQMKISIGRLLKALPAKQVAIFVLTLAAEILEGLDADTIGTDDQAAKVARSAAKSLRDLSVNDKAIEAAAKSLPNTDTLNTTEQNDRDFWNETEATADESGLDQ